MIAELLPVVKDSINRSALDAAAKDFARKGDFEVSDNLFRKAKRLGTVEKVHTVDLDQGFNLITHDKVDLISCGVPDLDLSMGGGIPLQTLIIYMAPPGGGKSMNLIEDAGAAIRAGEFTGFITLELPLRVQLARMYANLTHVTVNSILRNPQQHAVAEDRYNSIRNLIGPFAMAEFSPKSTTVKDLVEWIDEQEQKYGRKMTKLVIDYADKMVDMLTLRDGDYKMMEAVYEHLRRDIAVEREMRVSTATQSTRVSSEIKLLDLNNVSDSMGKARVTDILVTLNYDSDLQEMVYFFAKNRLDVGKLSVGPLPVDWRYARAIQHIKELGNWP